MRSLNRGVSHHKIGSDALFFPSPAAPVFLIDDADSWAPVIQYFGPKPAEEAKNLNRTVALALTAVAEALRMARLSARQLKNQKLGVALGTTVGCTFFSETYYRNWRNGRQQDDGPVLDYLRSNLSERVQGILEVAGPRAVLTNACASGTDAIGLASRWLRSNLCERAIAGGADALSRFACNGFSSLMLVSRNRCRPFDANRDGLNLGEGAGILVLEKEEAALARGVPILGWVLGYGMAGDAYHPTAPHPEGRGLQEAIRRAVVDAEIRFEDIHFINAHGTGTPASDAAELAALFCLGFSEKPRCPIVSTKGATGHTLGAAGGIEAVLTLGSLRAAITRGTIGCRDKDPGLPPLLLPLEHERRPIHGKIGMSLSLAFGGGNSALILKAA